MISVVTPLFGSPSERQRLTDTQAALAVQTTDIEQILVVASGDDGADTGASTGLLECRSVAVDPGDDWLSAGLAAAASDRVAVLFAGDRCTRDALGQLDRALDAHPGAVAIAYADHRLAPTAPPPFEASDPERSLQQIADHRSDVVLKPAPSPEYLRSKNFIANAAVVDRRRIAADPFLPDPVDAIHDLVLRATEVGAVQVPAVLFDLDGPVARLGAGVHAVETAMARSGTSATVVAGEADTVRVHYHRRDEPLVSVIIPTRGSIGREWGMTRSYVVDAVASVSQHSTYQHLEFVVVYDRDTPTATLAALERVAGQRLTLVEYAKPFNFSDKINVGVGASNGELVLLLNDDTELIEPETIAEMVALVQQPGVGTVGARLLYADATLQHGGHVYSGEMLHACEGWPGDSPGPVPLTPLAVTRETTGVTAAAAMVKRDVFDEVGGFSPEFPVNFNDVDFCLKLVAAGYRNLWTPNAVWYHFESVSRGRSYADAEVDRIFARWAGQLQRDPYYNPNLIPKRADWLEQPGLDEW